MIKKLKKCICALLTVVMVLSSSLGIQAAEKQVQLQDCAEKLHITITEIIDFKENLYAAFDEFNKSVPDDDTDLTIIKISENLYLQVETVPEMDNSMRSTNITLRNSAKVKNALGQTLITLTAVGTFNISGQTVKPISVYGLYDSTLYSVDSSETHLGTTGTVADATVIYKCVFNVGVGDWVIPFFSANISGTLYCDYNGNPESTWSGI